jgi:hypothetical protein
MMGAYRTAIDTARRRIRMPTEQELEAEIAFAEQRWADAARWARMADTLPDGPSRPCAECLPKVLMWIFSEGGIADSAVAAYQDYLRTPIGARKWTGQETELEAPLLERMSRMLLAKGDTTRAAQFLAMFVERWKNADPELQPRVSAAREQLRRLQLDAPER